MLSFCRGNGRIVKNTDGGSYEEEAFYETFGNITDGISVEHTIEYWPKYNEMQVDFDENINMLGGRAGEVMVCPYVFYEMCINSDATYSLCRFDWNHAMRMDPM